MKYFEEMSKIVWPEQEHYRCSKCEALNRFEKNLGELFERKCSHCKKTLNHEEKY